MCFPLQTPTYLPLPAASNHHNPPSNSMASPLFFLFLVTIKHLTLAAPRSTLSNPHFLLKLTKDVETKQYTTQLRIGTPQLPTTLVLHLSAPSPWLNCPPTSTSRTVVNHASLSCLMARSSPKKSTSPAVCNIPQLNPVTGESTFGYLAEDIITVDTTGPMLTVDRFLFSCSPEYLLKGLVKGAKGVLGFGRSKIGFHSQMVNNFDFSRKFTLCLSTSNGFITSATGISNSLSYTPLASTPGANGYYITINSVRINGRRLAGQHHPIGNVELSSTLPYTVMKTGVYENFKQAFVTAAGSMNMTRVSPVAPFGVCFMSQPTVPEIELVLQSELVKWRIEGRNSMVEVGDSVMCLGFVDGGLGMNEALILGGYQLEDRLLEFNLGTGMMGFSSSLVTEGKSCSEIGQVVSRPVELL